MIHYNTLFLTVAVHLRKLEKSFDTCCGKTKLVAIWFASSNLMDAVTFVVYQHRAGIGAAVLNEGIQ